MKAISTIKLLLLLFILSILFINPVSCAQLDEDFEDLNDWTVYGHTWAIIDGYLVKTSGSGNSAYIYVNDAQNVSEFWKWDFYIDNYSAPQYTNFCFEYESDGAVCNGERALRITSDTVGGDLTGVNWAPSSVQVYNKTWYSVELSISGSNIQYYVYYRDNRTQVTSQLVAFTHDTDYDRDIFTIQGYSTPAYDLRVDNIFVDSSIPDWAYPDCCYGDVVYNNINSIIFSNTTDYLNNVTEHSINDELYITTFINDTLWGSWWVRNFATLNYIVPSGESYNIGYITQQNASQFTIIPDTAGVYNFTVRCDFFCGVFDYYTIFSEEIEVIYPYNTPDDLLFSDTLDYNTSITEHPLNESFYLNVWIEEGSSMSESDYFGHWRINVTSPTDTYLGTYYPVRNYYQGSYPIQISMNQFNGTGKYGNYTFKMFFALTPDEMNTGEVLIKEAIINLYNSSNYNDTGYYDNITQELGDVPDSDISNYTDIPELQFLNNSFSYDTFVWIATPIHTMHIGIDSINNYYSDMNNTQHITVLGSIVPILISNLPEKVKLLFTYQIILTIILLIMGRD